MHNTLGEYSKRSKTHIPVNVSVYRGCMLYTILLLCVCFIDFMLCTIFVIVCYFKEIV